MNYQDLRDFLAVLKSRDELLEVPDPVSTHLEMTCLSDKALRTSGPALLFRVPCNGHKHFQVPVLTNLFGTPRRVALGMGAPDVSALREIGELLASLKEPEPPKGLKDAGRLFQLARTLWDMKDRLILGMDQRWAYVSASMLYGKVPWIDQQVPIEEADKKLREFLKELSEEQIDWNMIPR